MKILVTGAGGQLGKELRTAFDNKNITEVTYCSHADLDVTDPDAITSRLRVGDYTHIVNCAAYTAVDRAEEEKAACLAVNTTAVENIARAAAETGVKVLHISTDYVFDGNTNRPYDESAKTAPLSVYGNTKRKGETALLGLAPDSIIVRTGWLYSPYGKNFVKTMAALRDKGATAHVVSDQTGTPTYAADLADAIAAILLAPTWMPGIYHYSDEGVASWYDVAVAIYDAAGKGDLVVPISTADYPTAATRPLYAVLDKTKIKRTFGITIPHWQCSLRKCLNKLTDDGNA